MWTHRQTPFVFNCLCGVCSANRRTLSIYFKEKYVLNHADVDVHFATAYDFLRNETHSSSQRVTSETLAHSLVWQTLNKQLFGICLGPACLVRVCVQMWTRLNGWGAAKQGLFDGIAFGRNARNCSIKYWKLILHLTESKRTCVQFRGNLPL